MTHKEMRKKVDKYLYSNTKEWNAILHQTKEQYAEMPMSDLIELRWKKRVSWQRICYDKLYIDKATMHRWKNEILNYAVYLAGKANLL